MEVTFSLTKDDLHRVWQWERTPLWLTCCGLCLAFLVQAALIGIFSRDYLLGAVLSLVTAPFYLAATLRRCRRLSVEAVHKALARDPHLIGPRTVRLERDGLFLCLPAETRCYAWDDVQEVDWHSRYLLILVRAVGMTPIPRAAFPGRPEAEAFWTALMAYKMTRAEETPPVAAEAAETDATVWPPPPRRS